MTLEFFLVLLALVVCLLAAMWVYAAIFDFVDEWKKKVRDRAMLTEGRLPPMAPAGRYGMTPGLYDYDAPTGPPSGHERRPKLPKARRMMD